MLKTFFFKSNSSDFQISCINKKNYNLNIILFIGEEQIDFDEVGDEETFMSPEYTGTVNTSL